ncbi:MAG: type II secretion system F family protein [Actinomycetes bacterium]
MANVELLLGLIFIGSAVGILLFAVLSHLNEKAVVRESLRHLEGYEVENVRDQELLVPIAERAFSPVLGGLTKVGRRFTPEGYTDSVRKKYIQMGDGSATSIDRFLALRVVTVALVPLAFVFVYLWNPLGVTGLMQTLLFLVLAAALLIAPDTSLSRKVEARQHELRVMLPDILDLLTISVEAGLGFEQALDRTIAAVPCALSDEFSRMLGEVRAGASRASALRALDKRTDVPEVRSFVLAILQADTFGVSIGRVMRSQADEMRTKRRQMAEEKAQKAPVKMLIPMVFCVFPALFVIVIGPAIINIRHAFAG